MHFLLKKRRFLLRQKRLKQLIFRALSKIKQVFSFLYILYNNIINKKKKKRTAADDDDDKLYFEKTSKFSSVFFPYSAYFVYLYTLEKKQNNERYGKQKFSHHRRA